MNKLSTLYNANKRLWQIGMIFIVCVTLQNYPWLLAFLPDDLQQDLQSGIYFFLKYSVGLALFFIKQFNTSGNGTFDTPYTKPTAEGNSRLV